MIKQKIISLQDIIVTGEEFETIIQEIIENYKEYSVFIKYVVTDKDNNEYIFGKAGVGSTKRT